MKRVLITGMSGTGKSSLLDELAARGYRTVDTDYGGYFQVIDGERRWREDRISALLSSAPDEFPGVLFVQGTTRNQVLFYPCFDRIVLLSAPPEVLAERLAALKEAGVTTLNVTALAPTHEARVADIAQIRAMAH